MLDVTVARGRTTRPILSSVGFDIQLKMARFAAGSESTAVTVEIPAGPGTHSLADWAVFVETRRALLISILGSIYLDGIYPWIEQVPEIKEFPRGSGYGRDLAQAHRANLHLRRRGTSRS